MLSAQRRAQAARSVRYSEDKELRYSEDQPRDPDGEFASGGESKEATDEEANALYDYQGTGYHDVNDSLRGREGPGYLSDKQVDSEIANLDSLIAKQPVLDGPTTVFRTMYIGSPWEAKDWLKGIAAGSTFTDQGFLSTSETKSGAFSTDPASGSVLMEIDIPAGVHALDVQANQDILTKVNPNLKGSDNLANEHELLLPRGLSFTVDSGKWSNFTGGHMHLTMQAPS